MIKSVHLEQKCSVWTDLQTDVTSLKIDLRVLVKAPKYYTELQRLPRRISVRPPTKVEQIDCSEQGRHILSAPPLTLVISLS